MLELTMAKKRALRAKSHQLKPVVIIGDKGLSAAVTAEIERALVDHALIKVKIVGLDKPSFTAMGAKICLDLNAALIHTVGHIVVIYRQSDNS